MNGFKHILMLCMYILLPNNANFKNMSNLESLMFVIMSTIENELLWIMNHPEYIKLNTRTSFLQPWSLTRNCVYETLCSQPLACPPFCSPGNLFTILFQLTKSEATSFYSFLDIFIGSYRCPNLQMAFIQKNAKAIYIYIYIQRDIVNQLSR